MNTMTTFPLFLLASEGGSGGGHHHVSPGVTYLFALILALMILALALEEKIHAKKSLITGVFAVLCLFLGTALDLLPFAEHGAHAGDAMITNVFGEQLELPVYIPAIDWGVIAIILGSSVFVDVVSKSGLFTWIAIKLTKASRGDPVFLLTYYCIMTVVFSALLNNVTAMLIVGSLTAVSLDRLGKNSMLLGFLLVEGLLTNVGGLLTLISSVPNIIVGNAAGIEFVEFFIMASPYVAVATAVTILIGARRFGVKRLATDEERAEANKMVSGFDENDGIESRSFFWTAAALFVLFIMTLATASILPVIQELEMGYVALAFAVIILIRYKSSVDQFYKGLDWDLLFFFAALFVVINVMEHAQVLALIGTVLKKYILSLGGGASAALLASSSVASAVTDNIPLAAMMAKIIGGLPEMAATVPVDQRPMDLWWSVVFGANLGGNITPIGSASTVVAVTVMHKHGLKVSFGRFVKLAVPFAIIHILLAVGYVVLFIS
jgi:Na+/H+ antiporter NhaD/arsenite permease-like protein